MKIVTNKKVKFALLLGVLFLCVPKALATILEVFCMERNVAVKDDTQEKAFSKLYFASDFHMYFFDRDEQNNLSTVAMPSSLDVDLELMTGTLKDADVHENNEHCYAQKEQEVLFNMLEKSGQKVCLIVEDTPSFLHENKIIQNLEYGSIKFVDSFGCSILAGLATLAKKRQIDVFNCEGRIKSFECCQDEKEKLQRLRYEWRKKVLNDDSCRESVLMYPTDEATFGQVLMDVQVTKFIEKNMHRYDYFFICMGKEMHALSRSHAL